MFLVVFALMEFSESAVNRHTPQATSPRHGDVLSAISDGMVALLKEFYGHGRRERSPITRMTWSCVCCAAASRALSRRCLKVGVVLR